MPQWQELIARKEDWERNWILGGELNDIRHPSEKAGGRARSEACYLGFRKFIERMEMEEVMYQENNKTWGNNWEKEGYI